MRKERLVREHNKLSTHLYTKQQSLISHFSFLISHSPLIPHSVLILLFFLAFTFSLHATSVRHTVIPENPRPGEPVTIGISDAAGARYAVLVVNGRRLAKAAFFTVPADERPFMAAVLSIPSTARQGAAIISIEGDKGVIREIAITIAERVFPSEEIHLTPQLSSLRADPNPQRTAESEQLWAILNRTGKEIYGSGSFSPPVSSTRLTSVYGDRRIYRYSNGTSDTSIHAGVDYGVPTGTDVASCGAGKVVMARYRIITGYTVIIEHLPGVYSLYYHLDSIAVADGAMVDTGTFLGKSGATGLATGPHLHWEIRVSGENTDPDAFISRPILDKDALFSQIYN